MTIYKPRREATKEINPASTLILAFGLQNSEEFLPFKPPGLWYLVTAALGNYYTAYVGPPESQLSFWDAQPDQKHRSSSTAKNFEISRVHSMGFQGQSWEGTSEAGQPSPEVSQ